MTQEEYHEQDLPCDEEDCQTCCEHGDRDDHCCLICGKETDLSDFYDEDYGKDR